MKNLSHLQQLTENTFIKQNNHHTNSPHHPINKKPTNNHNIIITINNLQHNLKLLQSAFVKITKAFYYFKNKFQRTNKTLPTVISRYKS